MHVISRTGEQRRAAWESQGASPSFALPVFPVSERLEGASAPTADGAICKKSVHGGFASISLSGMKIILATIDGTPTVY